MLKCTQVKQGLQSSFFMFCILSLFTVILIVKTVPVWTLVIHFMRYSIQMYVCLCFRTSFGIYFLISTKPVKMLRSSCSTGQLSIMSSWCCLWKIQPTEMFSSRSVFTHDFRSTVHWESWELITDHIPSFFKICRN